MLGLYKEKAPDLHTRAAQLYDSVPIKMGGEDLIFENGHIEVSDLYIACIDGFLDAVLRSDGSERPELNGHPGELLEEMYRVCDENGDDVTRTVLEQRAEVRTSPNVARSESEG